MLADARKDPEADQYYNEVKNCSLDELLASLDDEPEARIIETATTP
jgi:hypothetical protein